MCYKFFFLILFLIQLTVTAQNTEIIHHKRQFRGVWIATVHNLDWPSKPGLSNRQLKKEYIKQLDQSTRSTYTSGPFPGADNTNVPNKKLP